MNTKSFSGTALEKALKEGALTHSPAALTGMVKPSEKDGYVSFSQADCETWVDVPTDMIDSAEHIGQRACRDHSHPTMRITLKEPKDPEKKILLALLAQSAPRPSAEMQVGESFQGPLLQGERVPAQASMRMGRGGGLGHNDGRCWYYSCGTCSDGTVMLCSDVMGCPPDLCTDIVLPVLGQNRRISWRV